MRPIFALLALALLGADAPPSAAPIAYEIKYLEMKGLEWRSALHPRLQPVSRHDAATVWTSTREGASEIARKASKVIATPRVTANAMTRATFQTAKTRKVVTEMARLADGPVNHASYVAFAPRVEDETDGCFIAITGRTLEQGVLAKVKIEDKQVIRVHTLMLSEKLEGKDSETLSPTLQIPECARNEVAGEWLIPTDGVLVVSTGVHTSADEDGKAVVLERLAILSAKVAEKASQANFGLVEPLRVDGPIDLPVAATIDVPGARGLPDMSDTVVMFPMPAPRMPSRTIPMPFDANGEPVPLPPLPDDHPTPPTSLPGSSEPCATPQVQKTPPDAPLPIKRSMLYDRESRQADFQDDECCADEPENRPDAKSARVGTAEKPLRLRFPLNARTTLEIRASVSATPRTPLPSR